MKKRQGSAAKVVPYVVALVVVAVVIGLAVTHVGVEQRVMDLHNSGVWVTNDARGLFGRVNISAGTLDAVLAEWDQPPGTASVDVFQDQEAVVGRDVTQGSLFAIDTRDAVQGSASSVGVGPSSAVAMGGGIIATISADKGEIRTVTYLPNQTPDLSGLNLDTTSVGTLQVNSSVANGVDIAVDANGVVFAASLTGATALVKAGQVTYGNIGQSLQSVAVSLVNGVGVVTDPKSGDVYMTNGTHVQLGANSQATPQQPSTSGNQVVVGTTSGLEGVPLAGGNPVTVFDRAGEDLPAGDTQSVIARPVVLGPVVYGAWGGAPGHVVRIAAAQVRDTVFPDKTSDKSVLSRPVFRVNRGQVVLNDMADGTSLDVDSGVTIDDWDSIKPQGKSDTGQEQADDQASPQANPDDLWVRPGRMSVLHVLDNDTNPGTGLVAITSVSGPDADAVSISPDGQTLVVNVPPDQTSDMAVTYTITNRSTNGDGAETTSDVSSSAPVDIAMRAPGDNTTPNPFGELGADQTKPDYTVTSGGSLSIAVLPEWRDADSDAVTAISASVDGQAIPVTSQGAILYTAPVTAGQTQQTVTYQVSDGIGQPVDAVVYVQVLASSATEGVAPQAMSDVVRGAAGQSVTFYPLDNDVPGCDPVNRDAQLTLAAPLVAPQGLNVTTDVSTGAVTVEADQPGAFFLNYTINYGSQFAAGQIRVDIAQQDQLVAMPDTMVVRGTVPALVDVLANDHDSLGSMLSVVAATPQTDGQMQVAVVQGRWLRVQAVSSVISSAPMMIDYVMTNGRGDSANGQVAVSQQPAPTVDQVSVTDDYAKVRVGDVTSIPVLDNDASESGAPLVINDNVPGMPAGQLKVEDPSAPIAQATDNVGEAFVDGDQVRYLAPTTGDSPRQLRIEYQAGVALGSPVTGYVWITTVPQPPATTDPGSLALKSQAPAPDPIQVRAMVGDTITIPVNPYGEDPDGDSVVVTGLATPPQYGRITATTADSLTYESYPDAGSPGTDSFTYYVQDRYGAVGIGTVTIGLVPVGTPPTPLAVDDVVTAQPGSPVTVFPMANDVIPVGVDDPQVVLDGAVPGVQLNQNNESLSATAPGVDDPTLTVGYHVENAGQAGVSAQVSVRSQQGYLNPPRVFDHDASKISGGVASVNVLDNAWDVDGPASAIHIVSVGAPATFSGNTVSIPISDIGQIIPFIVEDGSGAQSMAVVFVPSQTSGHPVLNSGGLVSMNENSTKSVSLNDYITSPRKQDVHLTMATQVWTSPAADLAVSVDSDQQVSLTSSNNYVGPAALTVEVRDSPDTTDPDALTGVVTIPVQIGPVTPTLWCPSSALQVVQGGVALPLNISNLCRAWMPTQEQANALKYNASWSIGGDSIDISGANKGSLPSNIVTLQARGTAVPGSQSDLTVTVQGYSQVTSQILVTVIAPPKPSMSVTSVTDVKQGTPVTIPVSISSPMLDSVPTIVRVTPTSPLPADVRIDGTTITVTPDGSSHGVFTFDVVGSDLSDPSRTDRQVTASFSVTVYGIPDPPSAPQPGLQLRSQSAVVMFTPGADNGAPITEYQVQWAGGSQSCGMSTTCEIPGLTNGTSYQFQVRAQNKAGWSDWSPLGAAVTPNALPGPVQDFVQAAVGCGQVSLSWSGVAGLGTAPTGYLLTWEGHPNPYVISGSDRSYTVTGLDNNTIYTMTMVAQNEAGLGPQPLSIKVQPSCKPLWPGGGSLKVTAQDMGDTAQVALSWPAADPQGPTPVTYQVTRSGPDGTVTFTPTTQTSMGDSHAITYNGDKYTYHVTAMNATGGADHTSVSLDTPWDAIGAPAPWSQVGGSAAVSATATGKNGEITVAANGVNTKPNFFRDSTGTVKVYQGTTTSGTPIATLTPAQLSQIVTGFTNGQDATFSFVACNTKNVCNAPQPITLQYGSYGPLSSPTISASAGNGQDVCFTASADGNGRNATLVITADNGMGTLDTSTNRGAWSVAQICRNSNLWDTTITLTATLTDSATPRTSPTPATTTVRTKIGTPAAFADGAITVVPTGNNGELKLSVSQLPAANGGTLSILYNVNGGATQTATISGNSASATITGLTNGTAYKINVWANNTQSSNTPVPVPASTATTPYGPLAAPVVTAVQQGSGTSACVTVTGNSNGAPAKFIVTIRGTTTVGQTDYILGSGDGTISSGTQCYDTHGYLRGISFTAQLISQPGLAGPDRADSPVSSPVTATSPVGPPGDWPNNAITTAATDDSGVVTVTVNNWPSSNGGTMTANITIGDTTKTVNNPCSGSACTVSFDGLTDGTASNVTITACASDAATGTSACNGAFTTTVTSTARPTLSYVSSSTERPSPSPDKNVCIYFTYNPHGVMVKLTATASTGATLGYITSNQEETNKPICGLATSNPDWGVVLTVTMTGPSTAVMPPAVSGPTIYTPSDPKPAAATPTVSIERDASSQITCTVNNPSGNDKCFSALIKLDYWSGTANCTFQGPVGDPHPFSGGNGTYNTNSSSVAGSKYGNGSYSVSCTGNDTDGNPHTIKAGMQCSNNETSCTAT